jgi:hypothetical protein
MRKNRRLVDEYQFPGFRPASTIKGMFGDWRVRIVSLRRRKKKWRAGFAGRRIAVFTIASSEGSGICRVARAGFIWSWKCGAFYVAGAGR